MVNIRVKEIATSLTNKWLEKNTDIILEIIDIKYHTQMTDNNSESSVLIIYKTK
jgi:hypothetical protein